LAIQRPEDCFLVPSTLFFAVPRVDLLTVRFPFVAVALWFDRLRRLDVEALP